MATTPVNSSLGQLLRAVNQGIGALGRRGGPAIDAESSSDEEDFGDSNLDPNTDNNGDDTFGDNANGIISTPGAGQGTTTLNPVTMADRIRK